MKSGSEPAMPDIRLATKDHPIDIDVALGELIDAVYEAAEQPYLWGEFLRDFHDIIRKNYEEGNSGNGDIYERNGANMFFDPDPPVLNRALIEPLIPHVQRAAHISSTISTLKEERDGALGVIEQMPIGSLLISGDGRIISRNPQAEKILSGDFPLTESGSGKLRLASGVATSRLYKVLQDVSELSLEQYFRRNRDDFVFTQTDASGEHVISLLVVPAKRCNTDLSHDKGCSGVLVTSTESKCKVSDGTLKAIFGLTIAEARLVNVLIGGSSIGQATEALNISENTARSQLKSVFRKMNVERQTQMVRNILTSPAFVSDIGNPRPHLETGDGKEDFAAIREESITLRDGRRLCFAESGDPDGTPVLFCHSLFASRHQRPEVRGLLGKLGIRWIVPDRPGYGLSDPAPDPRLLQWPEDVAQLLDYLRINQCIFLGYSVGGVFAQACAYTLPERTIRLGLISSMGTYERRENLKGMNFMSRFFLTMARHMPTSIHFFAETAKKTVFRDPLTMQKKIVSDVGAYDKAVLANPKMKRRASTALKEFFRGGTEGMMRDLAVASQPWGFDPKAISTEILLWHGTSDKMVPHTLNDHLLQHPKCRTCFYEGEGHFMLVNRWSEILSGLLENRHS